jgi:hypothetical protein
MAAVDRSAKSGSESETPGFNTDDSGRLAAEQLTDFFQQTHD